MAMTIGSRYLMYVGGFRHLGFTGENAAAAARDDTFIRAHFARGGVSVVPISTTTGAGDMTVTWTNGARYQDSVLVSISNSTITEVGSFIGWGW